MSHPQKTTEMNAERDHRRTGVFKLAIGISVAVLGHFYLQGIGQSGFASSIAVFLGLLGAMEGARQAYTGAESKPFDWATYRRDHQSLYYLTRAIQFATIVGVVLYLSWVLLRSAPLSPH